MCGHDSIASAAAREQGIIVSPISTIIDRIVRRKLESRRIRVRTCPLVKGTRMVVSRCLAGALRKALLQDTCPVAQLLGCCLHVLHMHHAIRVSRSNFGCVTSPGDVRLKTPMRWLSRFLSVWHGRWFPILLPGAPGAYETIEAMELRCSALPS